MKAFRMVLMITTLVSMNLLAHSQNRIVSNTLVPGTAPVVAANPVVVIDSLMFTDEKAGILRVVATMNQIEQKFEPLRKEINALRDRLTNMRTDINSKAATQAQSVTVQQTDAANQLEVQIKRKAEDAQSDYQKQLTAALEPIQVDINNALKTFATSRGILLIIDSNRVPIIYAHTSIDITKDFIADYNRTHPSQATTPARP